MPTRSALSLVDTVAVNTPGAYVGAQAAFVRALVHEVERHHPEDGRGAPLREQLGEELARLAELLGGSVPTRDAGEPIDVLVVDDDEDSLCAAAAVVKSLGYPHRTARSAEEALREIDREPAAIVLSDWCMPGMSGLELCGALKRRAHAPYVILASAFHHNARLLDGVHSGVDDFLRKPLDVDEIEVRLLAASRLIRAVRTVGALRDRLAGMQRAPGAGT